MFVVAWGLEFRSHRLQTVYHVYFRYATYDVQDNTQYRTLTKAYGIRFVILVDAKVK